ncbi:hypothetical protein EYC84_005313 [Monilinia fructicola]|uniref:Uncharacterized protein n=1 Tax=Monilinia fructicola TaxID=38448 RepID=A0A5M9JZY4_MONFR|nr:hypothetical protein EYC84_005313 [Monilinia fructicola]
MSNFPLKKLQNYKTTHSEQFDTYKRLEELNALLSTIIRGKVLDDHVFPAFYHHFGNLFSCGSMHGILLAEAISSAESCEDAHRVISTFPYCKNYEHLTRFELAAISSTGFVLSRPPKLPQLPSSSSPTVVINIDSNPTANEQAHNLCTSLGGLPATGMKFITGWAGEDGIDLSGYDIVWLAALVGGIQEDKEAILKNGAWGLRSVLYCDFDVTTPAVTAYLDICVRMDPFGDVGLIRLSLRESDDILSNKYMITFTERKTQWGLHY